MSVPQFPVKTKNSFGMHWIALQCADIQNKEWLYTQMAQMRSWGCNWLKLITTPGGDEGWQFKPLGCTEWAFKAALESGIQPTLRIYAATSPPYDTPERRVMLRRFVDIAKSVIEKNPDAYQDCDYLFACEPANEIDVETETSGAKPTAIQAATGFVRFANFAKSIGVYPLIPSVGYGGPGENYLAAYHDIGEGHILDDCGIAAHPYAGAFPITPLWPYHPILLDGTPVTQEEWDSYHPWCWDIGTANPRHRELVNQWREDDANLRAHLTTMDQLYSVYNYGWFTIEWLKWRAQQLGHTNLDIWLTENGLHVGAMYGTLPRIDPKLHAERTLEQLDYANHDPQIRCTAEWILCNMLCSGNTPNWEDQAWHSHWVDPSIVTLPWAEQIIEPKWLPIKNILELNPIGESTVNKIGMHMQDGNDEALLTAIAQIKAPVNKTMNLSVDWCMRIKQASPTSLLVGRAYVDNQYRYKTDPAGLIQEMLDKYSPAIAYLDVIEVTNEAVNNLSTAEDVAAFDTFQAMFAEAAWERWQDINIGLFCLPTGNFGWPGEWKIADFPKSLALPRDKVYFCFHEYSWYTWDWESPARCLRYRTLMDGIVGNAIITECGMTHAVVQDEKDIGWQTGIDRNVYITGMKWYNDELAKDDYIIGATVFNCGPSSGWDTFESRAEVLEMYGMIGPEETEGPEEEEQVTEIINDAESYGVTIIPAEVEVGDKYWKAIKVHHLTPEENNGQLHIFLDVLKENGTRYYGANVQGWWGAANNEQVIATVDKPPNEPGTNIVLSNIRQVTSVACLADGYDSDVVAGMHTNHPDEGPVTGWGHSGNAVGHHSFLVEFMLVTKTAEEETEEPTEPGPEESRDEFIRRMAWDRLYPQGIERNPDAAFQKYAVMHLWYAPTTKEFRAIYDDVIYAVQGFVDGIMACVEGDWENIFLLDWNA